MTASQRRSSLLNDAVIRVTAGLVGLVLGVQPIRDNSAFTHLATGIAMVRRSVGPNIPRTDPYSYTAQGQDWTVQSWLPSWVIGLAHKFVGLHAVLLLSGAAFAAMGFLMGSLARTGRWSRTAAAATVSIGVGAPFWAPRPLMVGLLCLAAVALFVERPWPVVWLVPLGWVWVQSHGSFPLGLAFLGLLAVGAALDGRSLQSGVQAARPLVALTVGVLLGACNPLGPRLVVFPLTVLSKREAFSHIVEWKPLSFATTDGTIAIVGIAIALVLVLRFRVRWAVGLPLLGFVVLGASAQRNVAALAVVLAWVLGHALRVEPTAEEPERVDAVLRLALMGLAGVFVALAVAGPALQFGPYPVRSVQWAERNDRFEAPHRVLSRDFVGNFIGLRHGPSGDVFIDDRVDMYPERVSSQYVDLLHDDGDALAILDEWDVDTVIWPVDHALTRHLRKQGWRVAYREKLAVSWVVLIRPEA